MDALAGTVRHSELAALVVKDICAPSPVAAHHVQHDPKSERIDVAAGDLRKLTKAICRGDEAAFTWFYDRYSTRLYRHLLVLAKGNEGEAREVLQTVVLKAARKFQVFDDEQCLWAWLCRLARNSYIDLCRVRQREQRFVPIEEHKREFAEAANTEHRLSQFLDEVLKQLPAEDAELLRAAYVDKRPLQELADAAGQTYKSVESRLARLRSKLKTKLLSQLRHEESP